MAAISNDSNWKQVAMQRAERITDIWDVIKAYCGRAAEVVLSICMFVSIIGVLPGVHYYPWVGNLILSIQIIMLDMGGFALNSMAEHARDQGQEEAALKAEKMGKFLIRLVIATLALITIDQLASIAGQYASTVKMVVGYLETALILVRVISTVTYIHTIHSLRGSALSIQPTQLPTQSAQDDRIVELEKTVNNLCNHLQIVEATQLPIQLPTQSTQVVEEPTHDFSTLMAGLSIIGDVARFATGETIVDQDVPMIEADSKPVEQVIYPTVAGVSAEKVKQLITLFESGTSWRAMPGNYSQTVKPVRDAYESLHPSTH